MSQLQAMLNRDLSGQYLVEEQIGQGGMSVVFRARDLRHQRSVALKILRPEIARILGADRFLREIRIEAGLQHPNILPLLSSGEAGGIPYCILPLIEGPTLRGRLEKEGALPVEDAIGIAADLARALDHAHQHGIIHRDIKPENVLLSRGHALLADFGVARAVTTVGGDRLTSEGIVVGTPAYMSPEQSAGDDVDARSDLYSLGIVLYEMLAGEPPFGGKTVHAITARHQSELPPPLDAFRPGLNPSLSAVVHRALAKVPADRFRTASDMLDAIEGRWTPPDSAAPARRRRLALWGGAAAVLLVAAVVYSITHPPVPLDPTRIVVFPVADSGGFDNQIPIAIELALEHTAPLSWIHGWNWLPEEVRRDPIRLTGPRMLRLTRQRGARYYISGELTRMEDSTRLLLFLHDVEDDRTLHKVGAIAPRTATDLSSTGLEAITRLLLGWLAPGRHEFLVSLAGRRTGAVALQVQGEQEYRQGRFAPALDLFLRSLKEDSVWAYAAVKAAQAASWLNRRAEAEQLIATALRHRATLPRHYTEFAEGLAAYYAGRADSAEAAFTRVIAAAPRWEEAHMALGETYFHLLPKRPDLERRARQAFDDALAADSGFTPAMRHRAEIAFREGDLARGDQLRLRLETMGADSLGVGGLTMISACLHGRRDRGKLARLDSLRPTGAAQHLAAGARHPDCALEVYRAILADPGVNENFSWTAMTGVVGQLVATGRSSEALGMLDSSLATGSAVPRFLFWLGSGEVPEFESRASAARQFVDSLHAGNLAAASPTARWALAVWGGRRGETALLAQLDRLARGEAATGDRRSVLMARAIEVHRALAGADTAGAIALLERLKSDASLDALDGDFFEPLAPERILRASLLLAVRRYQEAHDAASVFDHGDLMFGMFVARSLAIRYRAMTALGNLSAAGLYQRRLESLGRADLLGQR